MSDNLRGPFYLWTLAKPRSTNKMGPDCRNSHASLTVPRGLSAISATAGRGVIMASSGCGLALIGVGPSEIVGVTPVTGSGVVFTFFLLLNKKRLGAPCHRHRCHPKVRRVTLSPWHRVTRAGRLEEDLPRRLSEISRRSGGVGRSEIVRVTPVTGSGVVLTFFLLLNKKRLGAPCHRHRCHPKVRRATLSPWHRVTRAGGGWKIIATQNNIHR
jgi:hypothetical protein